MFAALHDKSQGRVNSVGHGCKGTLVCSGGIWASVTANEHRKV